MTVAVLENGIFVHSSSQGSREAPFAENLGEKSCGCGALHTTACAAGSDTMSSLKFGE